MSIRNKFYFIISTFICIFVLHLRTNAQYFSSNKKSIRFLDGWSVSLNTGLTSFFGDLSVYDSDIGKKISAESKIGGGIFVTKKISNTFSAGGQILYAGLKGAKSDIYFTGTVIEASFMAMINLTKFINPNNPNRKLNIYATFGMGLGSVKSKLFDINTDSLIKEFGYSTNTIETVVPLGSRFLYSLNNSFDFTFDISIRRIDTDKLDTQIGNDNRDYYSYFAFGFTYHLFKSKYSDVRYNRSKSSPKRKFLPGKKYKRKP